MRLVKKHNIDLLGLQETHLHDQGVLDAQTWWLRKNGFAANFNRQLDQSDKGLGVTSCPPSRTPYTPDLTIFYISTLSMLFDVCDQSCWQSCVTPVEIRVDVLALCIPVF